MLREKIATEKKGGDKTVSSDNTGGDPAGRNYLQCCLNHLLIFVNPPPLVSMLKPGLRQRALRKREKRFSATRGEKIKSHREDSWM